ncbi:dual OB domain-containing protein [Archangium violaceum]|uniref:Dual OB-containing domain-containing protein n=1 Tax=Archangium violaceum Cb vi76 TaxID=1406225 RepID=A0A084SVZ8_9BACT|nr:hypothetical protein [Archangium violaceum]KFA92633.1 hypothetical protein Q664_14165 [Archangium violaceum Cb vi76]
MSNIKRIVCLANSRKLSGRCIAGKIMRGNAPGAWVRPVSDREHEEVSYEERQYEDGSDPSLLDIIDIHFVEARPKDHQKENKLLDARYYWEKVGRLTWDDLTQLVDNVQELWSNGDSTYHGLHDRVSLADAKTFGYSLVFICVDDLRISVFAPGLSFGNAKRRVQAAFSYNGIQYQLWVTDPVVEKLYLAKKNGEFDLGEAYITVSLGEPKDGECYKLVAAIITREIA